MSISQIINNVRLNNTSPQIKVIFGEGSLSQQFIDFSKCLEKNTSVKHLFLIHKNMTNEDAKILSFALIKNKTLESIKITRTPMNDVCVGYMAHVIQKNTALKKIDISGCKISERGSIALGFALVDNTTLRRIKIGKEYHCGFVKENFDRIQPLSAWKTTCVF
jgi:hypothetical protein